MNKQDFNQLWDHFRQKYGVYLRTLEAIPSDRYYTHPVPGMRSPAELVAHISGSVVRDITEGVAKGGITADESSEAKVAADLGSKPALMAFAKECFERASAAAARIGDAELAAMVPTPWKASWPGTVAIRIMNDEFVHHHGQLTAFVRLCGGEPPFLWGFGDNAAEYQPRGVPATAGA